MSRPTLPVQIRLASADDLVAINDIYNHYVHISTATYQEAPESMDGRRAWLTRHQTLAHPATVAQTNGGEIVGSGSFVSSLSVLPSSSSVCCRSLAALRSPRSCAQARTVP